jgi:hypothetical protein
LGCTLEYLLNTPLQRKETPSCAALNSGPFILSVKIYYTHHSHSQTPPLHNYSLKIIRIMVIIQTLPSPPNLIFPASYSSSIYLSIYQLLKSVAHQSTGYCTLYECEFRTLHEGIHRWDYFTGVESFGGGGREDLEMGGGVEGWRVEGWRGRWMDIFVGLIAEVVFVDVWRGCGRGLHVYKIV